MTAPTNEAVVAALRIALKENAQLRRQLEAPRAEPVAIIGMGCRYPGSVTSPDGLWRVVSAGRDAAGPVQECRGWPKAPYSEQGMFIDADRFDAEFFGLAADEALWTHPQERLLLETAWEAIEHARIDPTALRGSRTATFIGIMTELHDMLPAWEITNAAEKGPSDLLRAAGVINCTATGRLAHFLDLRGPAITVDSACSSALAGLHLAVAALRAGECELALIGGSKVTVSPALNERLHRHALAAPDGRSKSFAASADGAGWGEGVGMLLLEPLSRARSNGHRVLAVIRGSSLSHAGARTGNIIAPNGPTLREVVGRALADAGLTPDLIDVVEGHGMGTVWGDPIEAQALVDAYGTGREHPLFLGSVKSNIGHAQAAASIAGVIKTVEAIQHGVLPKTLHVDAPTPKVNWSSGQVELLTDHVPWPDTGRPRRAAVSFIGGNGTSGHLILEQAPAEPEQPEHAPSAQAPWVLSAKTEPALRQRAAQLTAHLDTHPGLAPLDVACSLATTRTHFACRATLSGSIGERTGALRALAGGGRHPELNAEADPAAAAYLRREAVDWTALFTDSGARQVDLPTYPFQHQSFWLRSGRDD